MTSFSRYHYVVGRLLALNFSGGRVVQSYFHYLSGCDKMCLATLLSSFVASS